MNWSGAIFILNLVYTNCQVMFPGEDGAPSFITQRPPKTATPINSTIGDPDEVLPGEELIDAITTDDRQSFGRPRANCRTPEGERGICSAVARCPAYSSLLSQLRNPGVLTFLRRRICSFVGGRLQLCCPSVRNSNPFNPNPNPPFNPNPNPTPRPFNPTPRPFNPPPNPSFNPDQGGIIPTEASCGLPQGVRVTGGFGSQIGAWPWLAALGYSETRRNNFIPVCGGTVITRRHVLTAAHCFGVPNQREPDTVRVGEYDLSNPSDAAPQDLRIISRRSTGYNRRTNENDIMLLQLDNDINFNDFVQPACLPFSEQNTDFTNQKLTVVGWGRTNYENSRLSDIPQQADVPLVNINTCIRNYQRIPANNRPVLDNRQLCAGNGVQDACNGDSGGPLNYLGANGRYYVVGIVSFGVQCAKPEFPGVYTKVSSFLPWITSNLQ